MPAALRRFLLALFVAMHEVAQAVDVEAPRASEIS
jgi:hypothetical protein